LTLGASMKNVEKFRDKVERELKSGFIALLILYTINNSKEPIYGYKIIQEVNRVTDGKLRFREGTVYPILRYLQTQNFLKSYLGESPNGAPRKYYTITVQGKTALSLGLQSWEILREALSDVFENLEMR
jgi:PadR family transcriptional regulator PadR